MSAATPILFGAAAVSLAVGELVDVQSLGFTEAAQVRSYLAAPGLLDLAAAGFLVGAVLLVLAVATAWSAVQGRGARFVRTGLALIAVGAVWYAWTRSAGDLFDARLAHLPAAVQAGVQGASDGWGGAFDAPMTLAWLTGPIVLWIGLRRARRAPWLLLVVYVLAAVVETAFAFVSLPVEAATCLIAVGSIAVMTSPAVGARIPAPTPAIA